MSFVSQVKTRLRLLEEQSGNPEDHIFYLSCFVGRNFAMNCSDEDLGLVRAEIAKTRAIIKKLKADSSRAFLEGSLFALAEICAAFVARREHQRAYMGVRLSDVPFENLRVGDKVRSDITRHTGKIIGLVLDDRCDNSISIQWEHIDEKGTAYSLGVWQFLCYTIIYLGRE